MKASASSTAAPRRVRLRYWIIGVGVVLLIAGLLAARPLYRASKSARARQFATEAGRLLAAQDPRGAYLKLLTAVRMASWEPTAQQAMARFLTRFGQEQGLVWWERFFSQGLPTLADRHEAIRLALATRRDDLAGPWLNELLKGGSADATTLALAGEFQLALPDLPGAVQRFRASLERRPDDVPTQLLLARTLASEGGTNSAEARQIYARLGRQIGDFRLTVLQAWIALPDFGTDDAEAILPLLDAKSEKPTEVLMRLDILIKAKRQPREQAVIEAMRLYRGGTADELAALSAWLLRHAAPAEALACLPVKFAQEKPVLFRNRLTAFAALKQWKEGYAFVRADPSPLDPLETELHRARFARELPGRDLVELHWRRVFYFAGSDAQHLRRVADFARAIRAKPEEAQAWEKLTTVPYYAHSALVQLVRLAQQRGDTRGTRNLVRRLREVSPENPAWESDDLYLSLLLNDADKDALVNAERLRKAHPEDPRYRVTAALALLREKEPERARELYGTIPTSWFLRHPEAQALGVGILAACGKDNAARALARQVLVGPLLPEERSFIAPWLDRPDLSQSDPTAEPGLTPPQTPPAAP